MPPPCHAYIAIRGTESGFGHHCSGTSIDSALEKAFGEDSDSERGTRVGLVVWWWWQCARSGFVACVCVGSLLVGCYANGAPHGHRPRPMCHRGSGLLVALVGTRKHLITERNNAGVPALALLRYISPRRSRIDHVDRASTTAIGRRYRRLDGAVERGRAPKHIWPA